MHLVSSTFNIYLCFRWIGVATSGTNVPRVGFEPIVHTVCVWYLGMRKAGVPFMDLRCVCSLNRYMYVPIGKLP